MVVAPQRGCELLRRAEGLPGGADGLVGLLRVLALARVEARLVRHGLGPVELRCLLARRVDRLLRERGRVGAHVGDVAVLVERLRDAHGLPRGEAELARRLLLQRRRGEGRGGATGVGLRLDALHLQRHGRVAERLGERFRAARVERTRVVLEGALVVEVAAGGDACTVDADEAGVERQLLVDRRERCRQIPVRGGDEGQPLALAVHDQPGGGGLHAARGQAGTHLAPEHGRHFVAIEAVEDAPRLLRVHEGRVDVARAVTGPLDGLLGDFVEHHALDRDLRLQHLEQVPRDGLALAVLIRREEELVGVLERPLEVGDRLLLLVADDVVRLEAVLHVDGELAERALLQLGRQVLGLDEVADVADGGLHLVAAAQVLGDRLGLGRRLDDDQLLRAGHVTPYICVHGGRWPARCPGCVPARIGSDPGRRAAGSPTRHTLHTRTDRAPNRGASRIRRVQAAQRPGRSAPRGRGRGRPMEARPLSRAAREPLSTSAPWLRREGEDAPDDRADAGHPDARDGG